MDLKIINCCMLFVLVTPRMVDGTFDVYKKRVLQNEDCKRFMFNLYKFIWYFNFYFQT